MAVGAACPSCGALTRPGDATCPNCGASLAQGSTVDVLVKGLEELEAQAGGPLGEPAETGERVSSADTEAIDRGLGELAAMSERLAGERTDLNAFARKVDEELAARAHTILATPPRRDPWAAMVLAASAIAFAAGLFVAALGAQGAVFILFGASGLAGLGLLMRLLRPVPQ